MFPERSGEVQYSAVYSKLSTFLRCRYCGWRVLRHLHGSTRSRRCECHITMLCDSCIYHHVIDMNQVSRQPSPKMIHKHTLLFEMQTSASALDFYIVCDTRLTTQQHRQNAQGSQAEERHCRWHERWPRTFIVSFYSESACAPVVRKRRGRKQLF